MLSWSHYKLRKRMEQATKRVPDFLYMSCNELDDPCDPFKGEVSPLVVNRDLNVAKNIITLVPRL
jgi:hypothetical protein